VIFKVEAGVADVQEFGSDYAGAIAAYEEIEKRLRDQGLGDEYDVVLLGADSLATVKKTHSSYFDGEPDHGFVPFFKDALVGLK
jgi:hypothetical protein